MNWFRIFKLRFSAGTGVFTTMIVYWHAIYYFWIIFELIIINVNLMTKSICNFRNRKQERFKIGMIYVYQFLYGLPIVMQVFNFYETFFLRKIFKIHIRTNIFLIKVKLKEIQCFREKNKRGVPLSKERRSFIGRRGINIEHI